MRSLLVLIAVLAVASGGMFFYNKSANHATDTVRAHMDYNYTYDKREVFNDDADSDLAELDGYIKLMSAKAATISGVAKSNALAKIQKLSDERAALAKKLDALKNASEKSWNALKTDYQKSDQEMKTSLNETAQWLAEKAPAG